ncbi:uncharacterized protein T551_02738 [Pneumocystis jirovecii RU7]|uniref:Pre-rRNA-processing protein RIX1 n=1 Tax=Pneumocystis jirovecii (strain RU7) TaxID=1408657 RepID=A0A0W4ZIW9_PNEJ7|nr:uncharacterized protein T551_02738 [Pneumocystis jirovecii RU7]KTW28319.1 hypothetical protein T551_02738 [Pneumocystis jirovecii RU7]
MIDNQRLHQDNLLQRICTHIVTDLTNYRPLYGLSRENALWNQWCTRICSLLGSKTAEKRWFGVCLVKITAEQSPEGLFYAGNEWCQRLLDLLNNETCTAVVRRICLTMCWIFVFCHGRQGYMRVFVRSFLGMFIKSLIKMPMQHPSITEVFVECISAIVELYPSACRAFVPNIRTMAIQAINETHTNRPDVQEALFLVFSKLHLCAEKNLGQEQWNCGVLSCLWVLHKIIDNFFHSSIKGLKKNIYRFIGLADKQFLGPHMSLKQPEWVNEALPSDFYEAFETCLEKFEKYIRIIQLYLNQCTPYCVKIPAGQLFFFIYRVFRISDKSNVALALDNKEKLYLHTKIPHFHLISSKLLADMIRILNSNILPHLSELLGQLNYVFSREKEFIPLKVSIYDIFTMILHSVGSSISSYKSVDMIIQEALNDLNQLLITSQSILVLNHKSESKKKKSNETLNVILNSSEVQKMPPENIIKSALNFISSVLSHLCPGILSTAQRSLIDKTIVSIALSPSLKKKLHKQIYDSLINSILSPGDVQAIILPHVIRIFETQKELDTLKLPVENFNHTKSLTLDSILHPRFPPLQRKFKNQTLEMDYSGSEILEKTNKIYFEHLEYENKFNTSEIINTSEITNTSDISKIIETSNTQEIIQTPNSPKIIKTSNTSEIIDIINTPNIPHTPNNYNIEETLPKKHSLNIAENTTIINPSFEQETKVFLNNTNNIQNNDISKNIYKLSTITNKDDTKNTISENMETDGSESLSDTEIPTIIMEDSSYEE